MNAISFSIALEAFPPALVLSSPCVNPNFGTILSGLVNGYGLPNKDVRESREGPAYTRYLITKEQF